MLSVLPEYNKSACRAHSSLPMLWCSMRQSLCWQGPLDASRCAVDMDAEAGNQFLSSLPEGELSQNHTIC